MIRLTFHRRDSVMVLSSFKLAYGTVRRDAPRYVPYPVARSGTHPAFERTTARPSKLRNDDHRGGLAAIAGNQCMGAHRRFLRSQSVAQQIATQMTANSRIAVIFFVCTFHAQWLYGLLRA